MTDQERCQLAPVLPWESVHQIALDLFGRFLPGEPESACEPQYVGIDSDTFVFSEDDREDDGRSFPTDAGQFCECLHGIGHLPAMILDQQATHFLDVPRFAMKRSTGMDIVLEFDARNREVILRRLIFFIEQFIKCAISFNV